MKKHLKYLLPLMVFFLSLSGCSKDNTRAESDNTAAEIIGVWGEDNYFISFGTDGSYEAYLGDYFMDSGRYTYKDGIISSTNSYSNINSTYKIISLDVSRNQICLLANYIESKNNTNITSTLKFARKRKDGYQINNSFIGKTYYNSSVKQDNGDTNGGIFYFQSPSLVTFSQRGADNEYHTQTWNYFYAEPYIYSKRYTNEGSLWYNNRWYYYNLNCNNGKVYRNSIYIYKTDNLSPDPKYQWAIELD